MKGVRETQRENVWTCSVCTYDVHGSVDVKTVSKREPLIESVSLSSLVQIPSSCRFNPTFLSLSRSPTQRELISPLSHSLLSLLTVLPFRVSSFSFESSPSEKKILSVNFKKRDKVANSTFLPPNFGFDQDSIEVRS